MTPTDSARLSDDDIIAYRELAASLPPGPWCYGHSLVGGEWRRWIGQRWGDDRAVMLAPSAEFRDIGDAERFVIESRDIGPALADEVLRLREEIQLMLEFWPYDMLPDSPYWRLFALIRDDEQEAPHD